MFNTRVKKVSLPNQTAWGQFVWKSKASVSVFAISFIWKFVCNAENFKPTNNILTQVLLFLSVCVDISTAPLCGFVGCESKLVRV